MRCGARAPPQKPPRRTVRPHPRLQVCISQEGYFLVDKDNQIAPKPSRPIHFVSACAVDFAGESGLFAVKRGHGLVVVSAWAQRCV